MESKKAYDEFYQLLENKDEVKIDNKLFSIIQNYAKARLQDLVGINVPLHIYFKEESRVEDAGIRIKRYNPITGEVCHEPWNANTRAFYCEKGVFADLEITDNYYNKQLKGYKKAASLIDYAFTIEHELQHVKQFNELSKGTITYPNLKMTKNEIAISYTQSQKDELNRYFYHNAHNNLFLELDANKQATRFVGEQIASRKLGEKIVEVFQKKKYDINSILNSRIKTAHVGSKNTSYVINMILGLDDSEKEVKLCDDPEKIVDLLIDNLVAKEPTEILKEYPILQYVYNNDGTKKTLYEIKEIIKKKPETNSFYEQLIDDDTLLKIQKLEDNMIHQYCNTTDNKQKRQLLDTGLDIIKDLINSEKVDLNNILVYLDKRTKEIEQSSEESHENKNISKLIFYMTKQAILQSDIIENAYLKTSKYKEELSECQEILSQKCNIKLTEDRGKIQEQIRILIVTLEHDWLNKIYSKKGYSKEEINELIKTAKKYQQFLSQSSYILLDDKTLSKEESKSVLPGYNNLYQTNYYKIATSNSKDSVQKAILKNNFEIINQMYIESQKNIRITGTDPETSAIEFVNEIPIIDKLINDNPDILEILYEIRNTEEDQQYLTRLDALIIQCESYLKKNTKKR